MDTQSTRVMLDGEEFEVEFDETTDNVVGGQDAMSEIDTFAISGPQSVLEGERFAFCILAKNASL